MRSRPSREPSSTSPPFLDAAVLPRAPTNTIPETYEVDFARPEQRLIAELDGCATHGTRTAFEHDRTRHRRLQAEGRRVIRITWRHLRDDPAGLAQNCTPC